MQEQSIEEEVTFDEEEAEFIAHTNFMFPWNECVTLVKKGETTIYAENLTLQEALEHIDRGWEPIPF